MNIKNFPSLASKYFHEFKLQLEIKIWNCQISEKKIKMFIIYFFLPEFFNISGKLQRYLKSLF